MKEYKVIINTETGIICTVETFVRNVNEEQKSAYTVGKIYGEGKIYESEELPSQEQVNQPITNHLLHRISALEDSRDSIRKLLEECLIEPRRIIALEEARHNQSQINNTMNVAYNELKEYTLQQIDNIIKEIYLQRLMRGSKNKTPEQNVRTHGERNIIQQNPESGVKRGRGRPRIVTTTVKSKKQGRGRPKKDIK